MHDPTPLDDRQGPRSHRGHRPAVRLTGIALGATPVAMTRASLIALLLLPAVGACGGSDKVTALGVTFSNAQEVLASADERFLAAAVAEPATLHDDSRCYYQRLSGTGDIDFSLWCGPILRRGGEGLWDTYQLLAAPGQDLLTLGEVIGTSGPEPSTDQLFRPDGDTPPRDVALLPPPLPPNSLMGATEEELDYEPLQGDAISTRELEFRITGVARGDTLGRGTGTLVAAEGQELTAFKFRIQGGPTYASPFAEPEYESQAALRTPSTALDVLPLLTSRLYPGVSVFEGAVVVSLAEGSEPVLLELSAGGRSESVSVATGKRAES